MKKIIIYLLLASCPFVACKKYLDKTPDKKLAIPRTVQDLQDLLENNNLTGTGIALPDLGTDDYYLSTYTLWQSKLLTARNSYLWEKDIFGGAPNGDWGGGYQQIYTCNVVLEGLKRIDKPSNPVEWNRTRGHALFCRSFYFYNLSETFGYPYKPSSASSDLGIPLRLTENMEEVITRATVQQTFERIVADLEEAKDLLPVNVDLAHRNRPSKAAALAMLARVYLTMQDYDKANMYADQALGIYNTLVDYHTYTPFSASRTFKTSPNELSEIIYSAIQLNYGIFSANTTSIDSTLYNSYDVNDWRKTYYFGTSGTNRYFKGQYTGLTNSFCGVATDEIYFIRAETFARKGNVAAAIGDLNTVLVKRWKAGTYTNYNTSNADTALVKILAERRKELIFRGLRWSDLRRLNQDPRFAKTLTRVLNGQPNGQLYTLAPNSPRYVYPIPDNEILLSGIAQNPR